MDIHKNARLSFRNRQQLVRQVVEQSRTLKATAPVFHVIAKTVAKWVLIFPTFYAMTGGLILQWVLGYNFSVAVRVGYIALFGIAVEMVVYLHEKLRLIPEVAPENKRLSPRLRDISQAIDVGAVQAMSQACPSFAFRILIGRLGGNGACMCEERSTVSRRSILWDLSRPT